MRVRIGKVEVEPLAQGAGHNTFHFDEQSRLWRVLAYQFDHVPWIGCAFWDLIQPSFMFMVGVAMPYSYARRQSEGHSTWNTVGHVLSRSLILILLGIFLSSPDSPRTNFIFPNVLAQIGLGYPFVYLMLGQKRGVQLAAVIAILAGYWYLFFQHPLPPADFDYSTVGIPSDWKLLSGLGAHWNKNTNFAAAVDVTWLNLFPRAEPFRFNSGGYQTLNFVPSMATMTFGLMAGEMLRRPLSAEQKTRRLVLAGTFCLLLGMAFDGTMWPYCDFQWVLCPVVKRIWTPSWAVFSTGWTLWMLAAFYWIIDVKGWKMWAAPLVVVGMNSIAMYCMAQLLKPWISKSLKIHVGPDIFSGTQGPVWEASAQLFVLWLICVWMYRQKIFVKI